MVLETCVCPQSTTHMLLGRKVGCVYKYILRYIIRHMRYWNICVRELTWTNLSIREQNSQQLPQIIINN